MAWLFETLVVGCISTLILGEPQAWAFLEGEKVMRETASIYIDLEMEIQSKTSSFGDLTTLIVPVISCHFDDFLLQPEGRPRR
jgi:hypothetical protein